jgi:hypothetical protein
VPFEVRARAEQGLTAPQHVRPLVATVALAVLLGGCGGGGSHWSDSACRTQADKVVAHAHSMLLHYGGGTVYPADMSYLGLKASLDRFDSGKCPKAALGSRLQRRLSPADHKTLLDLLPRAVAARIDDALEAT